MHITIPVWSIDIKKVQQYFTVLKMSIMIKNWLIKISIMNEKKIWKKKVMPQRGLELGTCCTADESANHYTMGSKYFVGKLNKWDSTLQFKKDHETVLTAWYSSLCTPINFDY